MFSFYTIVNYVFPILFFGSIVMIFVGIVHLFHIYFDKNNKLSEEDRKRIFRVSATSLLVFCVPFMIYPAAQYDSLNRNFLVSLFAISTIVFPFWFLYFYIRFFSVFLPGVIGKHRLFKFYIWASPLLILSIIVWSVIGWYLVDLGVGLHPTL